MIFGLIALFLLCALLIVSHQIERSQWSKERGKLLDRIQAGSLAEFKTYEEKPDAEEKAEPEAETTLV